MRDVARFGFVALSVALVGCGGGGGGGGGSVPTVQPDPDGAATVTEMTVSLSSSLQAGDGASLSNNVMGLGMSGPQLIAPQPVPGAALIARAAAVPGPAGGTVDCTATGCIYDNYTTDAGGSFVMDGSVLTSASGSTTTVTVDLDITANTGGVMQDWSMTGSLDVSPTLIDGTLKNNGSGHLSAQGQNINYTYYEELTYNNVTLSNGQPTGGSIFAKWSYNFAGQTVGAQATMNF